MKERVQAVVAWGTRLGLEYTRTRASLAAGGLAYFVALSIAPAALAFGTLAGLFLDPEDVREVLERLAERAPGTVGNLQPVIDALVSTIESASATAFTVTTLVSALIAVYAASKVVLGVRMAMNTVFGVEETRSGLIERAVATVVTLVGLVAAVALVILLTLVPRVLSWLGVATVPLTTGSWLVDWLIVMRAGLPGRALDAAPCAEPVAARRLDVPGGVGRHGRASRPPPSASGSTRSSPRA